MLVILKLEKLSFLSFTAEAIVKFEVFGLNSFTNLKIFLW